MSDTDCPVLQPGQLLPAFTLPGADGMPYSPWQYKQRQHLLLLLLSHPEHAPVQSLLKTYTHHYGDFREEQCAILAITPAPVIVNLKLHETLHLPFPLLSDTTGQAISQYTHWNASMRSLTPIILLADRYSELQEQWIATTEAQLPATTKLLETLRYLNKLCTP